MGYVLVSLVDESDEATVDSDLLARHLRDQIAPDAFHSGASPDRAKIKKEAGSADSVGVLFGHNGAGTLRAFRDKNVQWANGPQLAEMFRDGRVYVFACETAGDEPENPLGKQAVEAGIRVFVGHAAPISSPDSRFTERPEFDDIQACFLAMVRAFLGGCDDEGALRTAGWDAYDALENGIGFSEGSTGQDFWSIAVEVQRLIVSLRVINQS
jgi:hypothetical protein